MDDWHDFFVTAAQAAAALAGLVFVGISINLEMIMANPRYGLAGRPLEALILLATVLLVTCLLIIPTQGTVVAGLEVLGVGIAALRPHFVTRVVLGQIATLPLVAAGIAVLSWGVSGLYLLAAGVLLSFLVSGANAWILLVEIQR